MGERDNLWARVIKSRHRELKWSRGEERRVPETRAKAGWWSAVVKGAGRNEDDWFWGKLTKKLGDGSEF